MSIGGIDMNDANTKPFALTPDRIEANKTQIKEILVEEVMSDNPLSISKDASISEVANTMMDTGYNGLPVVEDNNVIGIITQTDILRLIAKLES